MEKKDKLWGKIILYYGPMFSGKSEKLIDIFSKRENKIAFKPEVDNRTSTIYSRNDKEINCLIIKNPKEIIKKSKKYQYVFIDEIQFFDYKILKIIKKLKKQGKTIFASGLEYDYLNNEFLITKVLKLQADNLERLHANCVVCQKRAFYTARKINGHFDNSKDKVVLIENFQDNKIEYLPMCHEHHPIKIKHD